MIIFYLVDSKQIINFLPGFDAVSIVSDKVYVNGCLLLNTVTNTAWKYIADQVLERDSNCAYIHDADYYAVVEPEPSVESQLEAMNAVILDLVLGGT